VELAESVAQAHRRRPQVDLAESVAQAYRRHLQVDLAESVVQAHRRQMDYLVLFRHLLVLEQVPVAHVYPDDHQS
jgi:hypothetical protein